MREERAISIEGAIAHERLSDATELEFRLTKDLREAAHRLTTAEARYLMDTYYQIQQFRIEAANQVRAATGDEPVGLLDWIATKTETLERAIRAALDAYSEAHAVGRWAKAQIGIGPVIAAGLLAHIDVTRARTAGAVWRFAGLDPTQEWLGKEHAAALVAEAWAATEGNGDQALAYLAARLRRQPDTIRRHALLKSDRLTPTSLTAALARQPWNARLKVLCWKVGESFVRFHAHPDCFYGRLYSERKARETERNASGEYRDQAEAMLKRKRFGLDTVARQWYERGQLPPAQIHARAKRWAVKRFLAHYHHVAFESTFGVPPPKPYVIAVLGHADYQGPPGWQP